ncbi:hypothetical protein CVT24_010174 [Panaeolus cyanescens]|uniref:Uncharacterized protein n=1 Tax=Panaeolus cyanescens TaxID=181874 RepID=A0A409W9Q0_9AGAR|nr:hypothetical protein CVT24_010174 [Panaeolus cyanescens]
MQFRRSVFVLFITFAVHVWSTHALRLQDRVMKRGDWVPIENAIKAANIEGTYIALQTLTSPSHDFPLIFHPVQSLNALLNSVKKFITDKESMKDLLQNILYVRVHVTIDGKIPKQLCKPDAEKMSDNGFCIAIKAEEFKGKDEKAAVHLVLLRLAEQCEGEAKKYKEAWKAFKTAFEEETKQKRELPTSGAGSWLEKRRLSSGSLLARRSRVIKNDEK